MKAFFELRWYFSSVAQTQYSSVMFACCSKNLNNWNWQWQREVRIINLWMRISRRIKPYEHIPEDPTFYQLNSGIFTWVSSTLPKYILNLPEYPGCGEGGEIEGEQHKHDDDHHSDQHCHCTMRENISHHSDQHCHCTRGENIIVITVTSTITAPWGRIL